MTAVVVLLDNPFPMHTAPWYIWDRFGQVNAFESFTGTRNDMVKLVEDAETAVGDWMQAIEADEDALGDAKMEGRQEAGETMGLLAESMLLTVELIDEVLDPKAIPNILVLGAELAKMKDVLDKAIALAQAWPDDPKEPEPAKEG